MNILMLTSIYPQLDDGEYKATPTVQYFCRQWVKDGHNVIVIHNNGVFPKIIYKFPKFIKFFLENHFQMQIPSSKSLKKVFRIDEGVKVYRIPLVKYKLHGRFSKRVINKHINKILKVINENEFEPDLIIGHWANPQAELISRIKCEYFHSCKTALVFHNDCENSDIERYDLHKFVKNIDAIGCRNYRYSLQVKSLLKLNYFPFLCYSGLNNEIVKDCDIQQVLVNKKYKHVLYVGRLVKYKNVGTIIEAISNTSCGLTLKIVGSGTEKAALVDKIEQLNLNEIISFTDKLPHNEVFVEMGNNGIFVMVSENEVFGMVYLEAMLMGCIVVASKGCAVDGIIQDGINGFLCTAGDVNELTSILLKISNLSLDEKKKMSINAYNTAVEYTDEKVSRKYLEGILKIINCK